MELKRESLDVLPAGPTTGIPGLDPAADFRARQFAARDMLRGDLEGEALEKYVRDSVLLTTVDKAVAWARGNSFFPLTFGLACCAMEWMHVIASRVDLARFGWEASRASPRQADLIILSGRVSVKMAPVVRRIWDQMLEPKFAISMGACCSSTGIFNNYALVASDKFMPIDVHVPGCPPRPESVAHGIIRLREKIQSTDKPGWRERYDAIGTEEILSPETIAAQSSADAAIGVFPGGDTAGA
jgi:NADH-quinone oxidoreductase subunit B